MPRWCALLCATLVAAFPVGAQRDSVAGWVAASGAAVDRGEGAPDRAARTAAYAEARRLAERAVAAAPEDAEAHFALARALGRAALDVGARERVRLGAGVREHALAALARDSTHAGAWHVLGMWHAEVQRLNPVARAFAKAFLGGAVLAQASWAEAARCLERAVAAEPDRIVHRLDLGLIYRDMDRAGPAREQLAWVVRATPRDPNDDNYKRQAQAALEGMR
jgi:thioredoxin-like negative regulator of GroEL